MKHSIRKQFAFIFTALLAGIILLCWFINNTFLESYYIQNKKEALQEVYGQLNTAAGNGMINSDSFNIQLNQLCGKYNINVLILDVNSNEIKTIGSDPEFMRRQLMNYMFMQENGEGEILEKQETYVIQSVNDKSAHMEYLEMLGILYNGTYFIMRVALESIRESVDIANQFLAYVGVIGAIAGGIIIWYVTKKVTDPIQQLAKISERMTHLNFDVRYEGKSDNEISVLGHHINQLSETLEKTISELKTANNELMKDIERKNKTDEMRKEFLANVSHELKTPIALIQGYAEGLKEGINDDAESREFYCEVIMDESAKMNEMVKKLLTLNQLEFGNDVVTMERFDIAALVRNYIQSADILARRNDIKVRVDADDVIYVWGDEFKIEEVVMNYFSNAVNHAGKEKVIDVRVKVKGKHARVSVFNTGDPIPEESLPHLWEKFYKVDKARTREYGGSGVGLSIVKAIMESMNQKYGVINYENGVEFWFELERVEE